MARHSVLAHRLPQSGNTALAASALIQGALGIEFTLSGLNKVADPHFVANFDQFVHSSPGTTSGVLSPLVQALVLPNIGFFAALITIIELSLGTVLLSGSRDGSALRAAMRRWSR